MLQAFNRETHRIYDYVGEGVNEEGDSVIKCVDIKGKEMLFPIDEFFKYFVIFNSNKGEKNNV